MSYQANFTISYCTLTLPFFCIKSFVSPSVIGFLYLAKHLFSFLAFISLISFVIGLRLYYQYFLLIFFCILCLLYLRFLILLHILRLFRNNWLYTCLPFSLRLIFMKNIRISFRKYRSFN